MDPLRAIGGKGRDFVIIIDESESMNVKDGEEGFFSSKSRWELLGKTIEEFTKTCLKNDRDGVDFYFSSEKTDKVHITSSDQIKKLFSHRRPHGSTYLYNPLKEALDAFLKDREPGGSLDPNTTTKTGQTIILITDSTPYDGKLPGGSGRDQYGTLTPLRRKECQDEITKLISETEEKIGKDELRIRFIQVGKDQVASDEFSRWDKTLKVTSKYKIADIKGAEAVSKIGFKKLLEKTVKGEAV